MATVRQDPIIDTRGEKTSRDRLFFATGVLLSADDLAAEQTYHRGRLARALAYLHGSGTVAGLKVTYRPEIPAAPPDEPGQAEQIVVQPGMAVDRLGRIIEIPRTVCIRLDKWYAEQEADALNLALHPDGVIADVFVEFVECERGKTPAFATGPFDALNGVVPSRVRDGYELRLVLRNRRDDAQPPPLPRTQWPDVSAIADPEERRRRVHEAIFDAWSPDDGSVNPGDPEPEAEYEIGQDLTAVFLARVFIGATPSASAGDPPARTPATMGTDPITGDPIPTNPQIDNDSRLFAYTTRLLARPYGL